MKFDRCWVKLTMLVLICVFFIPNLRGQATSDTSKKLFSFGLITDIQYADAPKRGNRDYRGSLEKLSASVQFLNQYDLSFVMNLGDFIDHDYESFDKPERILSKLKAPLHNVIGNHEFTVDDNLKKKIRPRLVHSTKGYYSFRVNGFRCIILDGSVLSTLAAKKNSKAYKKGMKVYKQLKEKKEANAHLWNGGLGTKQFRWLKSTLNSSMRKNEQVIIFCHWPLLPYDDTSLWGYQEVVDLLKRYKNIVAYISGHKHRGDYIHYENIHYLTLKAIVESKAKLSCGIMTVYTDKLVFRGVGDQISRVLAY